MYVGAATYIALPPNSFLVFFPFFNGILKRCRHNIRWNCQENNAKTKVNSKLHFHCRHFTLQLMQVQISREWCSWAHTTGNKTYFLRRQNEKFTPKNQKLLVKIEKIIDTFPEYFFSIRFPEFFDQYFQSITKSEYNFRYY